MLLLSDTDSIYLNLGPLVETVFKAERSDDQSIVSFLNKVCEVEFEKYITSSYQTLASYVNAYDQKMFMKVRTLQIVVYGQQRKDIY